MLSLYVPPGRPVSDVLALLREEFAITDNIKLKRTKLAVQRALSSAIDKLSKVPKTPDKGLVIFCGENVDTGDFIDVVIIPPEEVPVFFYRTDKFFHTEFLEEMISETNVVGLIVIERDQATIGVLKGNRLVVLDEIEGYVPGKHHKGGQSQRRFDRIIEQMVEEFFKKVGEHVNKAFLPLYESGKLKTIIVGGPAYSKFDFVNGDYVDYRLKKAIAPQLFDVSYQGEPGLKELVVKASDILRGHEYLDIIDAVEEFKLHLAKDDGLAIYGEQDVEKAIELGALKTLIICGSRGDVEKWLEKAKAYGAKAIVIHGDVPEHDWLMKTFNGLVGVLRYRVFM